MPYDVRLRDLYNNCLGEWQARLNLNEQTALSRACAWLEAVNIRDTWRLVAEWFGHMQGGTANDYLPNPFWEARSSLAPLTPERVDEIIAELDADIQVEVTRLNHADQDLVGSGFARLAPPQRLAFAQALYDVMRLPDEMFAEALRKLDLGIAMVPGADDPAWTEH